MSKSHPLEEEEYPPVDSLEEEEYPPADSLEKEEYPPADSLEKEEYPPADSLEKEEYPLADSLEKEEYPPADSLEKGENPPVPHKDRTDENPQATLQDSSAKSSAEQTPHSAESNPTRDSADYPPPYHNGYRGYRNPPPYYNGHRPYYNGWHGPHAPANGDGMNHPQPPWGSRGFRHMPQRPEEWHSWGWPPHRQHPPSGCTCPCTGPEDACSGSVDTCPNLPTNTDSGSNNTGNKEPRDNNSGDQKPGESKRQSKKSQNGASGDDDPMRNADESYMFRHGRYNVQMGYGPHSFSFCPPNPWCRR